MASCPEPSHGRHFRSIHQSAPAHPLPGDRRTVPPCRDRSGWHPRRSQGRLPEGGGCPDPWRRAGHPRSQCDGCRGRTGVWPDTRADRQALARHEAGGGDRIGRRGGGGPERSRGRDHRGIDSSQRPRRPQDPRATRGRVFCLRIAAQRHRRCRGRGARLRQRDHPPRWQGGGPLEPTTRREHPSCRQRERSPNRLRAAGRCRRSPGRG